MAEEQSEKTDEPSDKKDQQASDKDLLSLALDRFRLAEEAEKDVRDLADEDHKFAAGDQWPQDIKQQRQSKNRPCLTINRMPQFIRQITNDIRQNRPAIKVSPVDDLADVDTAKVMQGLIRHIEYSSNADIAYDTASENQVRGGIGYFRIVTEYCDPYSFEQDIRIKPIKDWRSVYLDPSHQSPDGSDAQWGFVFADLSYEEYANQFPDSEIKDSKNWGPYTAISGWMQEKTVRVAEYFYKELETKTLVKLSDGSVILKDQLPKVLPKDVTVIDERETQIPIIKWVKTNGCEVLDSTDWPGQWIPIVPVLGQELIVDGKRILESLVRHSKDSQRMLNYWKSCETEAIALAPKAPWIVAKGQIEGFEREWDEANTETHPYLQYNPLDSNGQPVPAPQRNSFEPAVQAITNAAMFASDDLKATTGIYDSALGNRSNENSGVAIQRRNIQAQTSNFHFVDNLSKSIRHAGRILVDLIPHIYDTERAVRILGEDGKEEIVRINVDQEQDPNAKPYDLNKGKYDVTVATGPSYETKRQEAVASMLDYVKAQPQAAAILGDILVKAMDFPFSEEISERLRKTLPPGIADDKDKEQQMPPEAQQQIAQMGQVIDQLTKEVEAYSGEAALERMRLESKERIEMAKIERDYNLKLAELETQDAQLLLKTEAAQAQARMNMVGFQEPIEEENQTAGADAPMADQFQQPFTGEQQAPGMNPTGEFQ